MKTLTKYLSYVGLAIVTVSVAYAAVLTPPTNARLATESEGNSGGNSVQPQPDYVHGQEIGSHNTGWRGLGLVLADLTPHSGVFKEPGVYKNLDIQGTIRIEANDVTIRGFRLRSSGTTYGVSYTPSFGSGYKNAVLEYGEIIGGPNATSYGVMLNGSNQVVRRLHIHGWSSGATIR